MASVNILCLFALLACATAYPYNVYRRSAPQKAVMFGGYYGHPLSRRSYVPPTMTMFAAGGSGDAVATNSFIGGQYGAPTQDEYASAAQEDYPIQANQQDDSFAVPEQTPIETPQEQSADEQQIPVTQQPLQPFQPQEPVAEEEPAAEDEEEAIAPTTVKPKKTVRRKQKPKTVIVQEDEEDDDDEQVAWPFGGRGYNAFFPISFGLTRSGGRQSLDEDGSYPAGSATAIANSFSTGKGGSSSSHATAFGDPRLPYRSYYSRRNRKH
ncbi:uncharacterized protein LOC109602383 isoform X2 [Aethina tumida]|uniref:uncharacterized protein LOC109602383 isoform X2 n=1 Tax=Aethina tumida TaxID=116153 RepID=UPI00096B6289|nr:uncharacterized protein LOC109602383 isoform X2 [Aethina tumida]